LTPAEEWRRSTIEMRILLAGVVGEFALLALAFLGVI
jgi:hypothetical protein